MKLLVIEMNISTVQISQKRGVFTASFGVMPRGRRDSIIVSCAASRGFDSSSSILDSSSFGSEINSQPMH